MCLKLKIKTPDLLGPNLTMYKRRNNILLQLLTDVKSLRQRIVHKKRFWYKGVLLKKSISSLQVTMFNRREHFFSEYSVSLFHKSNWCHPFFNGYGMDTVFLKEQLQPGVTHIQCMWQIFYLNRIAISKEHLQPYIWVVLSLFQENTCSDLVFSRILCFFETSTCSHLFFQRYWVNSQF